MGKTFHTAEAMRELLYELYKSPVAITVITKREDELLDKAKMRTAVPVGQEPLSRYEAAGLTVSDFLPLQEDPRYELLKGAQKIDNGRKK